MSRLRAAAAAAAAAVAVLCLAAVWGSHWGHAAGPVTPASSPRQGGGGGNVPVPVAGRPPRPGVPWFLTIGDSITFGFTRDPQLAGTNISWAPGLERQLAGQGRPWRLYDTACPSESTLSYATRCPGRAQVPFLAGQSQRRAVLDAIAADGAGLRLIVVALGSNDLLQTLSADPVAARTALIEHLDAILGELRAVAPGVPIVVAGIYDPFASTAPRTEQVLIPIDDAVAALAARLGDTYADFHAAINHPEDGAPLCTLVDCADRDIHPTVLGQQRLAAAVMSAVPPPA